jgi:protein SCO1/2
MTTLPSSSNKLPRPTLAALALVGLLGMAALYQGSMGFQVISTEDGRRLDIAERPRALPATPLRMPLPTTLQTALRGDGRVAIVTFVYTRCATICSVVGSQFQQLQAAIVARGLANRVRLISISFDPRDTPEVLADYARRLAAAPDIWRFASVVGAAERAQLLAAFGIVVVPAPLGEFQHNAALHVVGADARLMRVDDFDQPELALEHALALAGQRGRGT